MKRYTSFLILFIFCGCIKEPTEPEYKPEPNVFAILNPDNKRQKVLVGKSYKISEEIPEEDWCGVSHAEVKISHSTEKIIFHELLPDSPGIYVSEALLVEPSETYFLDVTCPDGKKVTGETTVPQRFRIETPADGDTVELEREFRWQESVGANGYLLEAKHYRCGWGVNDIGFINSITFDSLFVKYLNCTPTGGKRLTLWVWALDSNYYDYYKIYEYGEHIESYMHLNGGLGVFGSFVVSDSITVVIKQ